MKLTPLNITLACVLVWVISELNTNQEPILSMGWLSCLVILLIVVDLGFRMLFKELKQLWFLQLAFILIVGMLMIILKLQ